MVGKIEILDKLKYYLTRKYKIKKFNICKIRKNEDII